MPELYEAKSIFFKIDVEWFELNVLNWMLKTLIKLKEKWVTISFIIEIINPTWLLGIKDFFSSIEVNYQFKQLTNEDYFFSI